MTLSERDLKELYRRATARPAEGAVCPDAETLARAAAGELEDGERGQLAYHLAACSDCVAEYRMLVPSRADERGGEVRPFRPRSATWRVAAIAASAVLAAGLTAAVWLGGTAPAPPVASQRGARPSDAHVEPADDAVLAGPPERLAWGSSGETGRYRVAIFDAESTPLWTSPELARADLPLPDDVRERLRVGRFYWRVTALGDDGPRESRTFRFTVAP